MMLLWSNPDGTLAIMALAVEPQTPEEIAAARDKVIAKGKRTLAQFHGVVTGVDFPANAKYSRAWRFSAGAIVVKMSLASNIRWEALKNEVNEKLAATNEDILRSMEEGSINSAMAGYRSRLRAIIAVKPAGLDTATSTGALDLVRPAVLDEIIPR